MEGVARVDKDEGIQEHTVEEPTDLISDEPLPDLDFAYEVEVVNDDLKIDDEQAVADSSYLYSISAIEEAGTDTIGHVYYNGVTQHSKNKSETQPKCSTPVMTKYGNCDESEEHAYASIFSRKSDTSANLSNLELDRDVENSHQDSVELGHQNKSNELDSPETISKRPTYLPIENRNTFSNSFDYETMETKPTSPCRHFDIMFGGTESTGTNEDFQQRFHGSQYADRNSPTDDASETTSSFSSMTTVKTFLGAYMTVSDIATDSEHSYCISKESDCTSQKQVCQSNDHMAKTIKVNEGLAVTFLPDQVKTYREVCDTSKTYKESLYVRSLGQTKNYTKATTTYQNSKEQRYVSALVFDVKSALRTSFYSTSIVLCPKSDKKTNISRIDYHVTSKTEDKMKEESPLKHSSKTPHRGVNDKTFFTFGRWRYLLGRYGAFLEF